MTSDLRTYHVEDGRWVLTLHRRKRLSTSMIVAVGLVGAFSFAVLGLLTMPFADRVQSVIGTRAWATLVLGLGLFWVLVGLHCLMTMYLPDAVEVRNPAGDVVQKITIRSFLWLVFGFIYLLVAGVLLYGMGFLEQAHA